MNPPVKFLSVVASIFWLVGALPASAGFYGASVSPGNVPWPGGVIPYVFDNALSAGQKQTYLDGLREYEIAANIHFIPRTSQTQYILFKYAAGGPNLVSGSNPVMVEINLLTRGQICHETGHALGLAHEHQRTDRETYVNVLYTNVTSGNNGAFDIDASGHTYGGYDFESVMHYGRDVYSIQPGVLDTLQPKPGYEKYQKRMSNYALSPGDRALMAYLYGPPTVAVSSVVTTTADGGTGSLRAAMYYATDHPGSTVTFNIPQSDPGFSNNVFTIRVTGALPPFAANGVVVDGTTQPGYTGKPMVFLNGSSLLPEAGSISGFLFYETNNTVKGLGIQRFPWVGVAMLLPNATGNRVAGCSIGLDATGNFAAPNDFEGIQISDGAHGNFIGGTGANERNVISGNTLYGIYISGATTTVNTILGNYIGTNIDGNAALPNQKGGVIFIDATHHNIIGPGNVISGNTDAGIWITGTGVSNNRVEGNYIGLNAAGTAAVANTVVGSYVVDGASNNSFVGNVISGNTSEGLRIADAGTTGNTVFGNFVGTAADGNSAIGNGFAGVAVNWSATGNQVGGVLPGQRNILSGNGTVGLAFGGSVNNAAYGNYIGTNPAGTAAVPNGFAGVYITGGATSNHLGGGPGTGNLISGNGLFYSVGVLVADAGTAGNVIKNNTIGLSAAGAAAFTNQFEGISISGGAQNTLVGGTAAGAANIISGNGGRGIAVFVSNTAGHTFQRNSIYGNGQDGIGVYDTSNHSQAAPILGTAVLTTTTNVSGTLASTPDASFTIEFFASPSAFPADGRTYLGQAVVTADGGGNANIGVILPVVVTAGKSISATATSQATGDSSGFSNRIQVTSADADHDGMPDAYESAIPGLSSANASDAALDNDGDGFSNLQEFFAGTNPNDRTSRLVATGAVTGTDFQVTFATVSGRIYRVEASDALSGFWAPVAVNVSGTGGNVQMSFPISGARRFFRVTDAQ
ncbi:MAG: M12 family metallopeptidase [Luteolibacter sp.]